MVNSLTALLCLLLYASLSFAKADLRFYEWSPGSTLAPLIIVARGSETPEQAAERYLSQVEKNPELMELFEGRRPALRMEGFTLLSENQRESRALLIANLPKDYTANSGRITGFQKVFTQSKHRSFILPINANLGLSLEETKEMFKQIAEKFPTLVAMGGDDVEPELYKEKNFHARNTIPARDQFEISLIKSYVAQEKGFLLGVCRGSQISAVALGYKLIQDVPFHIGEKVSHANHWHDIEIKETKFNILKSLTNPGEKSLYVNSLHHQSVIYQDGGILQLAAVGSDGVTEATEFRNGRGLLLQFHPELMNNQLGAKILWRTLQQKNSVMPMRCSKIF